MKYVALCLIFLVTPAMAAVEETFVCPPGMGCGFRELTFSRQAGETVVKGRLSVTTGPVPFTLLKREEGKAEGSLDVSYTNGAVCSYPMTLTYVPRKSGLEVISQHPVSFPPFWNRCPETGSSVVIHDTLYLNSAAVARLGVIRELATIRAGTGPDQIVLGSWFLNEEGKSVCTDVGPQKLDKVVIDCEAGSAQRFSAEFDSKDLDPSFGKSADGIRICYHYPADLVNQPRETIRFPDQASCREAVARYRSARSEYSNVYFRKTDSRYLTSDDVRTGGF